MRRTPQEQVDQFVAANARHAVTAGICFEQNPDKPSRGVRYRTECGTWLYLGAEACKLLPEGYPRWIR